MNPGHSDPDVILQALSPGPSTAALFGPGKARMYGSSLDSVAMVKDHPVAIRPMQCIKTKEVCVKKEGTLEHYFLVTAFKLYSV